MRTITASVGLNCRNLKPDVVTVQQLLNRVPFAEGGPQAPLKEDGLAWDRTVGAIKRFQGTNLGHKWPDGRVDPGGKTMLRLNDYDQGAPGGQPSPGKHLQHMVPGHKPVIAQPTMKTCWAATYTMLRSWREGKTFAIEEALEKPGKKYVDLYKDSFTNPFNPGLLPGEFRDFWMRAGLAVRGNAFFADYIWHDFLKQHGLLAVGSANSLPPAAGLHLRVLEGMSVTGAATDCYYIMDSGWGGNKYPERAFDFEARYNLAMTVGPGAHWQVAHYY